MSRSHLTQCLSTAVFLSLGLGAPGCGSPEEGTHLAQRGSAVYGEVQKVTGDTPCPSGYVIATPEEASANLTAACAQLGTWDIARLAGSGAMGGNGYGCSINTLESSPLGNTLCRDPAQNVFTEVVGDGPCAPGKTLLSPQEARARESEVCAMLDTWDIARLSGGGSMAGPGYGCTVSDWDTGGMGHALCKSLY